MTEDRGDATASTDGRQKTARLPIPRMNCPWAARRVADYLQRIDGVVETYVKPRTETVVVKYDPALTSEPAITAAAERPGTTGNQESASTDSRHRSSGCQCRCRGGRR